MRLSHLLVPARGPASPSANLLNSNLHQHPLLAETANRTLPAMTPYAVDGGTRIFSRWTNHTQEARVYSHDGPIRPTRYMRACDFSDAAAQRLTRARLPK
eukprot:6779046-Pyramimonas_sp.AAC.2